MISSTPAAPSRRDCRDAGARTAGRTSGRILRRKEVIQPHLPIRLPCYDFTLVTRPAFDGSLLKGWATGFGRFRLPWCDGRCVQDPGTYSPQHADLRLLAIPASCSRVADYNPNWDTVFVLCLTSQSRFTLLSAIVARV